MDRNALIERAEAEAAKRSGGQATRRTCEMCLGRGDESRRRPTNAPSGGHIARPCEGCEGFGVYWRIRDSVSWNVSDLEVPPEREIA